MDNKKYIYYGRVIGILSQYQTGTAYQTRIRRMPLAVIGELYLKALKELKPYDEMFISDCLDRVNPNDADDDVLLTEEEYNKIEFNRIQWSCNITLERLMNFLKAKGLTQQQVADKLKVSVPTVQRWANNKTEPHDEAMVKLIRLCNDY